MAIIGSVVVDCHASTENRGSVFLTKNRTATTVATLGTFKTGRIRTFVIKRFILFIIKIYISTRNYNIVQNSLL